MTGVSRRTPQNILLRLVRLFRFYPAPVRRVEYYGSLIKTIDRSLDLSDIFVCCDRKGGNTLGVQDKGVESK